MNEGALVDYNGRRAVVWNIKADGFVTCYDADGVRMIVGAEKLTVIAAKAEAGWAR